MTTPSTRGTVIAIAAAAGSRKPTKHLEEAQVVANLGLVGCRHAKPGSDRQVLLVEEEVLQELGLRPGQIKENVTTGGIHLRELPVGARLRIGTEVVLTVTGPCDPCQRMEEIRTGLRAAL